MESLENLACNIAPVLLVVLRRVKVMGGGVRFQRTMHYELVGKSSRCNGWVSLSRHSAGMKCMIKKFI